MVLLQAGGTGMELLSIMKRWAWILALPWLLIGCDKGAFLGAENRSTQDVLLRYREGAEVRVFLVPAGVTGYLITIPGGVSGSFDVLTRQCQQMTSGLKPSQFGGTLIVVEADGSASVEAVPVDEFSDDQRLDVLLGECGSSN